MRNAECGMWNSDCGLRIAESRRMRKWEKKEDEKMRRWEGGKVRKWEIGIGKSEKKEDGKMRRRSGRNAEVGIKEISECGIKENSDFRL